VPEAIPAGGPSAGATPSLNNTFAVLLRKIQAEVLRRFSGSELPNLHNMNMHQSTNGATPLMANRTNSPTAAARGRRVSAESRSMAPNRIKAGRTNPAIPIARPASSQIHTLRRCASA